GLRFHDNKGPPHRRQDRRRYRERAALLARKGTGDKIAGVTGSALLRLRENAPATRSPALPGARCFACAERHRRQDRRRYRERAASLARKGAGVTGSFG